MCPLTDNRPVNAAEFNEKMANVKLRYDDKIIGDILNCPMCGEELIEGTAYTGESCKGDSLYFTETTYSPYHPFQPRDEELILQSEMKIEQQKRASYKCNICKLLVVMY